MFIQIDDNFAIKSDIRQYILCRKIDSKSYPDGWKPFQFFTKLDNLVTSLAEMMLRTSEAEGVSQVLEENKRILRTLTEALVPHFNVEIHDK